MTNENDRARSDQSATPESDQRGVGRGVTQHTPGPWGWDSRSTNYYLLSFSPEAPEQIVAQFERIPMDAIGQADRDLIAAAPKLLDALKAVEAHHVELNAAAGRDESRSQTLTIVRAAIAKAEGL